MGRRFSIGVGIVAGLAISSPIATYAQDAGTELSAVARALFEEGLQLAEERRWDEAGDRFRRAYDLRPAPGIAVNLASVLIPLGRLVEASELLERVIEDAGSPQEARSLALRLRADEVLPRIARLRIDLVGDARGVVITRNGATVPPPALGVTIPADPGTHEIHALRDGQVVASRTIDLGAGQAAEVALDLPPSRPIPSARQAASQHLSRRAPRPEERDEPDRARAAWWPWALGGAVLAAVAVLGVVVLVGRDPEPVTGNADPAIIAGSVGR